MTLPGAVRKTALSLLVLSLSAAFAWGMTLPSPAVWLLMFACIGLSLVITFKPTAATYLTLPYAVLEGFVVSSISKWYVSGLVYAGAGGPGLVWTALGLTVAIFAALLLIYATGVIKPSANFKLALVAATAGVSLFYLATMLLGVFGVQMPLVFSTGTFGLGFSLLMVVLASACLVADFDFVEEGVKNGLPKHMEWFAAFGLMVTVVWLYLEILRLLAKLQSRRN